MHDPTEPPTPLATRLVESDPAPGTDEELLSLALRAVPAASTLSPAALARVAARLEDATAPRPALRSWLLPTLSVAAVCALALIWIGRPAPSGAPLAQTAPPPPSVAPRPVRVLSAAGAELTLPAGGLRLVSEGQVRQLADGSLRVDAGTIAVHSDETELLFETPSARVRVAPRSRLEVVVSARSVRIAASAGSARIIHYDGRIELVAPPEDSTPTSPPVAAAALPHGERSPARAAAAKDPEPVAPAVIEPAAPAAEAPAASPLGVESASLTAALTQLAASPEESLQALDEHLARYPRGALRLEAERARVALLLRLGRRPEALAALDQMSAPSTELRVVRAELRAEADRSKDAIGDFDRVLIADDDRFEERALFGRASCWHRLGEARRARDDLERYLVLHPRGSFADRARALLPGAPR